MLNTSCSTPMPALVSASMLKPIFMATVVSVPTSRCAV
jgi:hypothetical protein